MVILILTTRRSVNTEDIVVLPVGGVITIAWFILAYACVSMVRSGRCLCKYSLFWPMPV